MKYLNKGSKARSEVSETLSMQIGNTIQSNVSNVAHVRDISEMVFAAFMQMYTDQLFILFQMCQKKLFDIQACFCS